MKSKTTWKALMWIVFALSVDACGKLYSRTNVMGVNHAQGSNQIWEKGGKRSFR